MPQRVVGVGAVDDPAQQMQSGISIEIVFLKNGFEGTLLSVMTEFDTGNVKRYCVQSFRFLNDIFCRNKVELGAGVYESLDQPWTGHTVNFNVLTRNPFHGVLPKAAANYLSDT
jgi:hypothetical protein